MKRLDDLPTSGGHDVIHTPAHIHGSQLGRPIGSTDALRQLHATELRRHHKPTPWQYLGEVQAFINANRWMFRCPQCAGGVSCGPEWDVACCFECGAVFAEIDYPENWREIEAVLLARPGLFNRNWNRGETLERLAGENVEHGHGVGLREGAA